MFNNKPKTLMIETSMLKLLMQGKSIILYNEKDNYLLDEVIGVKETFRMEGKKVFYASEENVQVGAFTALGSPWHYGNALKNEYIKRHVKIVNKKLIDSSSLDLNNPKIIAYNKKLWQIPEDIAYLQTIYNSQTKKDIKNSKIYAYELKLVDKAPNIKMINTL